MKRETLPTIAIPTNPDDGVAWLRRNLHRQVFKEFIALTFDTIKAIREQYHTKKEIEFLVCSGQPYGCDAVIRFRSVVRGKEVLYPQYRKLSLMVSDAGMIYGITY